MWEEVIRKVIEHHLTLAAWVASVIKLRLTKFINDS